MADSTFETRQVRFGYREQSDFDVPELVSAEFAEITCDPFDIDPGLIIHQLPNQHGSRNPVQQNTVHSTKGAVSKFSVNGPLDVADVDQFLYAHFQKVVEAGDTEYTKTFTYFTEHPNFASDEGHFLTWIKYFPESGTSQHVGGCIAPRFKITGERNGMLLFESDWVAYGTSDDDVTPSGTWTPPDGSNIVEFNDLTTGGATLTRGAGLTSPVAITLQSFELESVYEAMAIGANTTTGFERFGMANRSGTFKIDILRDGTVDEAISSMKVGEMVQLDLDFGNITITVTGKVESYEYHTEGLLAASLSCNMFGTYSTGSWGEPLTIVVLNSRDRSWPAA